ncbi:MAG: DUF4893 domain-containing protein [Rhizomicrobium sp.]|nr:DUF4893 domain-containing protein [Rhizomicrobium sp.]
MSLGKADKTFPPPFTGEVLSVAKRRGAFSAASTLIAALLLTAAAQAGWHEDASPRDVERLGHIAEARAKGLNEASHGNPSDYAAIRSILQAGSVPASEHRLIGSWRCRTLKLGGMTPSVVYGWFRCRIWQEGRLLHFEKLSGTQRTSGTLYPDVNGLVYLGASYVTAYGPAEKKPAYSGGGASAGADATPDDQIGLLSLTYDGRARLELPYPVQESTFDVIELKR